MLLVEVKASFSVFAACVRADSLHNSLSSQTESSATTARSECRSIKTFKEGHQRQVGSHLNKLLLMSATEEKKIQTRDIWMGSGGRHVYNLAKIDRGGGGRDQPVRQDQESREAPNRRRETNGTQTPKQRAKIEEWADNYC